MWSDVGGQPVSPAYPYASSGGHGRSYAFAFPSTVADGRSGRLKRC